MPAARFSPILRIFAVCVPVPMGDWVRGKRHWLMADTTLYIKNMVCDRCRRAVEGILTGIGLEPLSVELGVARVAGELAPGQRERLASELGRLGFELLSDPRRQTVDRIRTAIIELVHYGGGQSGINLSAYLAGRLGSDYSSLSKLFSESTGVTIERYFILQRVERVKELLFYGEKSLTEIALELNYSSVAYLSTQFKAVTGMTPSQFKAGRGDGLKPIDGLGGDK